MNERQCPQRTRGACAGYQRATPPGDVPSGRDGRVAMLGAHGLGGLFLPLANLAAVDDDVAAGRHPVESNGTRPVVRTSRDAAPRRDRTAAAPSSGRQRIRFAECEPNVVYACRGGAAGGGHHV
jgi:hypothetical protein